MPKLFSSMASSACVNMRLCPSRSPALLHSLYHQRIISLQPQILDRIRKSYLTTTSATSEVAASSNTSKPSSTQQVIRPLIPPPNARTGPLLERLPNRALPNIDTNSSRRIWLTTLPIFIALITLSSLAIFNYQKTNSSTVNSILYALRTHPVVRDVLGDEIYFANKVPWISGELNQLHGNIDISFWVKGTRGKARTRFVSVRKKRHGYFETLEWSLKLDDGREIQLLELKETRDPMQSVVVDEY